MKTDATQFIGAHPRVAKAGCVLLIAVCTYNLVKATDITKAVFRVIGDAQRAASEALGG